jgi:hypothetical protein
MTKTTPVEFKFEFSKRVQEIIARFRRKHGHDPAEHELKKILVSKVQRWFDCALRADDRKPSREVYEEIARKFRIIMNRQDNARRGAPVGLLKDVSPTEELNKRVRKFKGVANQLLTAASEVEDYGGGYRWTDHSGTVSLEDIKEILARIGAVPFLEVQTQPAVRGRPREAWHAAAHELVPLIKTALRQAGHSKGLSAKDEGSITAAVGAAAISWAYDMKIETAGFAAALRKRTRRKCDVQEHDFDERFPTASRIKIL